MDRVHPRAPVNDVGVHIDGNPAVLIDVSPAGAQVLSARILRPGQRVRLALTRTLQPLRVSAMVAWAVLEIPKGVPRYRAGLTFLDVDATALARFIRAHARQDAPR